MMPQICPAKCAWFAVAVLAIRVPSPFAQPALPDVSDVTGAVIDESAIAKTITVKKDGTGDFRTIKAAVNRALVDLKAGTPTRVRIHAGTYRESLGYLDFGNGKGRTALFVLEGAPGEEVIVLGSDVWKSGWSSYNNKIFEHAWNYEWGNTWVPWKAKSQHPHRSEMVFINGKLLRQRILETYSRQQAAPYAYNTYTGFVQPQTALEKPGTYGVAERDQAGNKLYVYPYAGTNMNQAKIEIAIRDEFIALSPKQNFVLRNLTISHFRSQHKGWGSRQGGAISIENKGSRNIKLENLNVTWNNQAGWRYGADFQGVTVRNCKFNHNGGSGIQASGGTNMLFENNETNFNNWRNSYTALMGWFTGGIKFHGQNKQIIRNHTCVGNLTTGLWWDLHARDVLLENAMCLFNTRFGVQFEVCQGPFLAKRCLFAWNASCGYRSKESQETTQQNCINFTSTSWSEESPVHLFWFQRGGNHGHFALAPGRIGMRDNIFMSAAPSRSVYFFQESHKPFKNDIFTKEDYYGRNNVFYHLSGTSANRFVWGEYQGTTTRGSYENWLAWVGKSREVNSRWLNPRFEDPMNLDFRFKATSPLKAKEKDFLAIKVPIELIRETVDMWKWIGDDWPKNHGYKVPAGRLRTHVPKKAPSFSDTRIPRIGFTRGAGGRCITILSAQPFELRLHDASGRALGRTIRGVGPARFPLELKSRNAGICMVRGIVGGSRICEKMLDISYQP